MCWAGCTTATSAARRSRLAGVRGLLARADVCPLIAGWALELVFSLETAAIIAPSLLASVATLLLLAT